jgi:archaellum biogenesis protein FlaJ (TadC family)
MSTWILLSIWLAGIATACVLYVRSQSDEDWPVGPFVLAIMLWPVVVIGVVALRVAAIGMRGAK